ncbi:MAG: polysaccharide deacetylase, partial [Oscillospiraceae bacterium]
NHTYSHDYKKLYSDVAYFMEDVKKADDVIAKNIAAEAVTKIFRFPGGSFEKSKDPQKEALYENGYVFVDWNCLNGDAEGQNIPPDKLLAKVKKDAKNDNVVILMHDAATKQTTVDALGSIIDYLRSAGYTLKALENSNTAQ